MRHPKSPQPLTLNIVKNVLSTTRTANCLQIRLMKSPWATTSRLFYLGLLIYPWIKSTHLIIFIECQISICPNFQRPTGKMLAGKAGSLGKCSFGFVTVVAFNGPGRASAKRRSAVAERKCSWILCLPNKSSVWGATKCLQKYILSCPNRWQKSNTPEFQPCWIHISEKHLAGSPECHPGMEVGDVARGGGHSSDTSSGLVKQKKQTTGLIKGRRSWLPLLPLEQ